MNENMSVKQAIQLIRQYREQAFYTATYPTGNEKALHSAGEVLATEVERLEGDRDGLVKVPAPPSAKMLREYANVAEAHHPTRGGETAEWLRKVADLVEEGKA